MMSGYCVVQSCRTGWTHFSFLCLWPFWFVIVKTVPGLLSQIQQSDGPMLKDELITKAEKKPLSQGQQHFLGLLLPPHRSTYVLWSLLNPGVTPGPPSFHAFTLLQSLVSSGQTPGPDLVSPTSSLSNQPHTWIDLLSFLPSVWPRSQILPRLWPQVSWYFPWTLFWTDDPPFPLGPCIHSLCFPPLLQEPSPQAALANLYHDDNGTREPPTASGEED